MAVDLGAQSCRVSLLRWPGGEPEIRVVHRFRNAPIETKQGLRWDITRIVEGVKAGLRLSAEIAPEGIASIGVDGWGVDYVRIDSNGQRMADPYCYRDDRTALAAEEVFRRMPPERMYRLTGIQLLNLNTVFQLYADKLAGVDSLARWVTIPEYMTHLLGARIVSEYTHATHTQLVALRTHEWCDEIFRATGLERGAAPEIVPTGTLVGELKCELNSSRAFQGTKLVVPACHDTASAIAAIPATGEDWAFISSGTWSLVGTVLKKPCVADEARAKNFTNLGGVGGTICFLKNVNGMWLLEQCIEEWAKRGHRSETGELILECEKLPPPETLFDVDGASLLLPGKMPEKINAEISATGGAVLPMDERGVPAMASVIFHSLAKRYAEVIDSIAKITGKKLKRLFIVGGGSKNSYLNRLTGELTGLEVIAGSSECTTIGNFAVQLAALRGETSAKIGVSGEAVARYAERLSRHSFAAIA